MEEVGGEKVIGCDKGEARKKKEREKKKRGNVIEASPGEV